MITGFAPALALMFVLLALAVSMGWAMRRQVLAARRASRGLD